MKLFDLVWEQVFEPSPVIRLFFVILKSLRRIPLLVPLLVHLLVLLLVPFVVLLQVLLLIPCFYFSRSLACWGFAQLRLLLWLFFLTHLLIFFILLSQPSSEPIWLVFLALFFSVHLMIIYCEVWWNLQVPL